MRLPGSKVYRAFPELDRFSDEECERFVGIAKHENQASMVLTGLLAAFVAVAGTVLLIVILKTCVWWILGAAGGGRVRPSDEGFGFLLVLPPSFLVGPVAGLLIRDAWLRNTINTKITTTNCPQCRYSLLGLAPADGAILCPECGCRLNLAVLGMSPQDFLAPK